MTDLKFTDGEIIELLRAYVERMCGKCNVKDLGTCCGTCFITPISQATDLINRQKAEIESLQAVHADATESLRLAAEANKDMQAKIERLQKYNTDVAFKHYNDGIKEFAERLKANMSNIARMEYGGNIYFCVGYDLIDNLVKEMTEESK